MSLNVDELWWLDAWESFDLTLTVDAQSLEPGSYAGRVRAEATCEYCPEIECVGCLWVDLTVRDIQGITEEEPPGSPDDPGTAVTWGQIKAFFR